MPGSSDRRFPRSTRGIRTSSRTAAAMAGSLVLLLSSILVAACDRAPPPDAPGSITLAVTNVTVIDLTGAPPARGRTVLIAGDRIQAVGSAWRLRIPPDVPILHGWDSYLIPGLWDMHVHLRGPETAREWFDPLLLAAGVTGVRDMGMHLDSLAAFRRGAGMDAPLAPRRVMAGPILDGPGNPWAGEEFWRVNTVHEAREAVDSLRRAGADFLKVYSFLSPEVYFAAVEEARRQGLPVAGHLPSAVPSEEAARAGHATFEHAQLEVTASCVPDGHDRLRELYAAWRREGFGAYFRMAAGFRASWDPDECVRLVETLRERGSWIVPTLVQDHASRDSASVAWFDLAYLPPDLQDACRETVAMVEAAAPALRRAHRRALQEEVRWMHGAGLPVLAGTDAPNPCLVPGLSLHQELERLVEAGLTPLQALRTATLNPARHLGTADSIGTIEAGKVADLVLLDGDPLVDIRNVRNVRAVLVGGRLLDRDALDELLSRAQAFAARD